MNVYDDELPVPEGWDVDHNGEVWTIRYVMYLDELIVCAGIEDMNELCDERTGVTLMDLHYAIGQPGPDDELGDNALIIEATGEVTTY